jgi:hypothetical protein
LRAIFVRASAHRALIERGPDLAEQLAGLARPGEGLGSVRRWEVQHAPTTLERRAILLEVGAHARDRLVSTAPIDLDRDLERWEREIESPLAIRVKPEFGFGQRGQRLQDAPCALERYLGGRSRGAGS